MNVSSNRICSHSKRTVCPTEAKTSLSPCGPRTPLFKALHPSKLLQMLQMCRAECVTVSVRGCRAANVQWPTEIVERRKSEFGQPRRFTSWSGDNPPQGGQHRLRRERLTRRPGFDLPPPGPRAACYLCGLARGAAQVEHALTGAAARWSHPNLSDSVLRRKDLD